MAKARKNPMGESGDLDAAGAIIYGVLAGSALWAVLIWVGWDWIAASLCWR